jgi:cobaltochelatase CobS
MADVGAPAPSALAAQLVSGAGVIVPPELAERVVERALASGETFAFSEIDCPEVGLTGDAVLVHPAFVRASARRGLAFYAGPAGKVRRFAITTGDKQVPPSSPPAVDGEVFYLKPAWFGDLAKFVERGEPVLLIGPAGAGKSEAVERVFLERGQTLRIVSCTQRMTANDLEGAVDLVVEDGHQVTRFTPADPAIASEQGHGLLLDEADAAPAEAMYAVYRLIDGKPMHILRKGVDSVIPRHDGFRVVGTQNTEGRGDDRGLHHGRSYQDEAFLDRWRDTIRVVYPPKEDEVLILRKRTGISAVKAERIVDTAQALRAALRHDEIMLACTMRRTLAVAGNLATGMTPEAAWSFAVLNRATPDDHSNIMEVMNRIYGDKWRKS